MDIQKKQGEHSTLELTITLSDEQMKGFREKALKKLIKEVKIDGFRKGHVPADIAKSRVGSQNIEQEAIDIAWVEDAGIVVEVDVIAGRRIRDARTF